MAFQAVGGARATDDFARLHRSFVQHFGYAVCLAWLSCGAAAIYAPWTRNLRGLIDPAGRVESTFSFLFGLPILMTVAWLCLALGGETIRRARLVKSDATEFAFAGIVAFAMFCMAIDRAVTAFALGA